ncbi:MAG: 50S ribosomal protein L1 [Bacteroidota bacterium]
MAKLTKKQREAVKAHDLSKAYPLEEALQLIGKISYAKFDASVDVAIRLGVDPRKADQMVRGTALLPHGTGKALKILVLCTPDKEKEAQEAGADYVGLDEYLKKIEQGWTKVDTIITMPAVMAKVGRLGKILGPRGLMPNPKTGTVTTSVGKAVQEVKSGKIDFKVDKYGIIHASIGRVSFSHDQLKRNALELLGSIIKLKPASSKGSYIKSISLSSTMSQGVFVDKNSTPGL